jgi:hypothetical protein
MLAVVFLALTAQAARAESPPNLSGDWHLVLNGRNFPPPAGGGNVDCIVYLDARVPRTSGGSSCDAFGTGLITGTYKAQENTFALELSNGLGDFALTGSLGDDGESFSGSYTLTLFPGITNDFVMTRLSTNYWGSKKCTYMLPVITEPQPPPVFGASAAAIDALRVGAGLGAAEPPPAYSCTVILDVNVDRKVDGRDAMLILQEKAELITRLPAI